MAGTTGQRMGFALGLRVFVCGECQHGAQKSLYLCGKLRVSTKKGLEWTVVFKRECIPSLLSDVLGCVSGSAHKAPGCADAVISRPTLAVAVASSWSRPGEAGESVDMRSLGLT